jgi:ParB family transcriptional regulator, chromosome partitioning protein
MAKSAAAKAVKKSPVKAPVKTQGAKIVSNKAAPQKASSGARRGLGKGLSALMSESYSQVIDETVVEAAAGAQALAINSLRSGKYQPRGFFDESALTELSDSIRKHGVMQPILVRPLAQGEYEIIAGERRWRAARMAGLKEIPALVRDDIGDQQALELALVENIQREGLHPLEEAAGFQRLMDEFSYTQEDLSQVVHKSRSHVANLLRLLSLPKDIRLLFADNKISMGHARALMGMREEDALTLAGEILRRELSVRQTEKIARDGLDSLFAPKRPTPEQASVLGLPTPPQTHEALLSREQPAPRPQQPHTVHAAPAKDRDPDILALEETLSENLGLKVSIQDRGQSGEITIAYDSLEQLDDILRRLGGSI